eukprot:366449-Chlamydomonas_euryale.AAC.5
MLGRPAVGARPLGPHSSVAPGVWTRTQRSCRAAAPTCVQLRRRIASAARLQGAARRPLPQMLVRSRRRHRLLWQHPQSPPRQSNTR